MLSMINPYAPPDTLGRPRRQTIPMYREDGLIVVRNNCMFPSYCVVTGTPISSSAMTKRNLWSLRLSYLAPVHCSVSYGMSDAIARKYQLRRRAVMMVQLLCYSLMMICGICKFYGLFSRGALDIPLSIFPLTALLLLFWVPVDPLRITRRASGRFYWIAGAGAEFLAHIPAKETSASQA